MKRKFRWRTIRCLGGHDSVIVGTNPFGSPQLEIKWGSTYKIGTYLAPGQARRVAAALIAAADAAEDGE